MVPAFRYRRQQLLGVRLPRMQIDVVGIGDLDDLTLVHHHDFVGDVFHYGEVVRYENIGQVKLVLQILQEIENLRLHRDVER